MYSTDGEWSSANGGGLRISAKADYAVRAAAELAAAPDGRLVKGEEIARARGSRSSSSKTSCGRCGLPASCIAQRGVDGGYALSRPAGQITVAEVLDAVEGPIAGVQRTSARGSRLPGRRGASRSTCGSRCARACGPCSGSVTLADLAAGDLPVGLGSSRAEAGYRAEPRRAVDRLVAGLRSRRDGEVGRRRTTLAMATKSSQPLDTLSSLSAESVSTLTSTGPDVRVARPGRRLAPMITPGMLPIRSDA